MRVPACTLLGVTVRVELCLTWLIATQLAPVGRSIATSSLNATSPAAVGGCACILRSCAASGGSLHGLHLSPPHYVTSLVDKSRPRVSNNVKAGSPLLVCSYALL